MKYVHIIAFILLVVGGLNWGLLALTGWDIGMLFGGMDAMISKAIYVLVALSAIYMAATHMSYCKYCMDKGKMM